MRCSRARADISTSWECGHPAGIRQRLDDGNFPAAIYRMLPILPFRLPAAKAASPLSSDRLSRQANRPAGQTIFNFANV